MNIFALDILRLQFTLEATDHINLPNYKGSAFHGGFGHALKTISPTWFNYFFQTEIETGNQKPKPFVLLPPLDNQQTYQPGETFSCELTLFAEATQHYAIAQAGIEYLGREMGLGYSRGKFKVKSIEKSTFTPTENTTQKITLYLLSRLRLKSNNQLQRQTPEFSLLIARLLGRLKTLQQSYSDVAIDEQLYRQLLQQAQEIQTTQSNTHWDDWDRYSGSQHEWMKFGGLLGDINYQGNLQAFIPYLQMGEWTHVGGKSSFGLGKYTISYGEE
ncbi:MAG: CRISPR system precrRNA processing endoribonuclease RAMP protein Cas6 [Methylococcales bacterium]|nr:CRISPR system precrRNA processing endoribonuclease RAMP protein Cas6 [Methylococcales bacterium]